MNFILSRLRYEAVLLWGMKNVLELENVLNVELGERTSIEAKRDYLNEMKAVLQTEGAKIPGEGILAGIGDDHATFMYAEATDNPTSPCETSFNNGSIRQLSRAAANNLAHILGHIAVVERELEPMPAVVEIKPLNIIGTKVNALTTVLYAIDAGLFDDRISDVDLAKHFQVDGSELLNEASISSIRQKLSGEAKTNDTHFTNFVTLCLQRLSLKQLRIVEETLERLIDQAGRAGS